MAQPHEYIGTAEFPAKSGESYEESWQPTPFPGASGPVVPGNHRDAEVEVTTRSITDAGIGASGPSVTTVISTTANPFSHVEFGRIGEN